MGVEVAASPAAPSRSPCSSHSFHRVCCDAASSSSLTTTVLGMIDIVRL